MAEEAIEPGGAHVARRYAFVNEEMVVTAREVQSYKFIPVIYQLVARIASKHKEGAAFQSTLHALVARIATDHPYHAMYQVSAEATGCVGLRIWPSVGWWAWAVCAFQWTSGRQWCSREAGTKGTQQAQRGRRAEGSG